MVDLREKKPKEALEGKSDQSYYIGISKLCCLDCRIMIDTTNSILKKDLNPTLNVKVRGQHDLSFEQNWCLPDRFKHRKENSELLKKIGSESMKAIKEFRKIETENSRIDYSPSSTSTSSPSKSEKNLPNDVSSFLFAALQSTKEILGNENKEKIIQIMLNLIQIEGFVNLYEGKIPEDPDTAFENIFQELLKKWPHLSRDFFVKIMGNAELVGEKASQAFLEKALLFTKKTIGTLPKIDDLEINSDYWYEDNDMLRILSLEVQKNSQNQQSNDGKKYISLDHLII